MKSLMKKLKAKLVPTIKLRTIKLPKVSVCQREDPQLVSGWNDPADLPQKTMVISEQEYYDMRWNMRQCVQAICDLLQPEDHAPFGTIYAAKRSAKQALNQLRAMGVQWTPIGDKALNPESKDLPQPPPEPNSIENHK